MQSNVRRTAKLLAVFLGALIILALFTTPAIYRLVGNVAYAHHVRLAADIQILRSGLDAYRAQNGKYPATIQQLVGVQVSEVPRDPWGSEYVYRCPGMKNPATYDLFSSGPDHRADTVDDDWGD